MINYGAERSGDVKHSLADVDKAQTAGFKPVTDLSGGLRATVEFFRKNIAAIEQGFLL
jgi:nucleoside-diphosphate-sugar epimerase